MTSILAIIPARSGSKSIPDKNIRLMAGKPLLAYSIEHALSAKYITRTIVSTDSPAYADIARQYGAEVPFLRPAELADDLSTDLVVFSHALTWLDERERYQPEICVHLRPTYPMRDPRDIDLMVNLLIMHPEVDSIRSVARANETPYKMWFLQNNGLLKPVVTGEIVDAHNMPRQALPPVYIQNACIDVVRTNIVLEQRSMTGNSILGYVMDHNYDIDTHVQFQQVEHIIMSQTPT
jgi:CMP-N-acetylneuraminic acid synthetase